MHPIYDELGGSDGVRTAVTVLYNRIAADPELAPWFADVDVERLKAHQRAFLSAAFGGPQVFSGRTAGEAHEGLEITDAAFDRVVGTLMTTLADLGVANEAVVVVGARLEDLRADIVSAGLVSADLVSADTSGEPRHPLVEAAELAGD
ncbi:group I truncated hemoglobin [Agromyces allii]|uniref:Group 1 truncated hemoglobin n=1 Tax=Agromyces allii TaxID=393607 RepID=A0ABP5BDB7_9MICO|nr:group 1 truncated hemoglobin [Agromyces allii]